MLDWMRNVRRGRRDGFASMVERFHDMLTDGVRMFDVVSDALLGGDASAAVSDDVFETDRRINRAEQDIRRGLIVHVAVHGDVDFPSCLVLMSIAKDAERIGDYCKNVFDLAVSDPLTPAAGAGVSVAGLRERVSAILARLVEVYESQNEADARMLIHDAESLEDVCDGNIEELVDAGGAPSGVTAALSYRYFKRIASHARNIVTSVIMPMDKLDFFDER